MTQILETPTNNDVVLNTDQVGGRTYRFCIHERDWPGGQMILKNIKDSVKNSSRTIILLSRDFASSQWCQHEFDEAYKEKKIIIIMMEGTKISDFNGNDIIQSYLRTYTYLKQEDPKIWKKLSYQLPHKQMEKVRTNTKRGTRALKFLRQMTEELPLVRNTSRDSNA